MQKNVRIIMISSTLVLSLLGSVNAQLKPEQFVNPPASARPMTWMHMMNGNASKEGLEKDLRALKDANVGGALIFSISYHGIPAGKTDFNSQKFRDVITHGAKVADEIGLKIGLHNCDGWSSSGGPWVTVEESMKQLVWSETVEQGGVVKTTVPQPEGRHNYYRDLAVIAFPATQQELAASHNPVTITSSDAVKNTKDLFDGDLSNGARVSLDKNKKTGWIQFEYEKPIPAQSLRVEMSTGSATCKLFASQDGTTFEEVVDMQSTIRPGKKINGRVAEFSAVDARFFKFEFSEPRNRGFTIHEIDLVAVPRRANWMAESCMTQDGKSKDKTSFQPSDYAPLDQVKVLKASDLQGDQLTTKLPKGVWRIMRFGYTSTGAKNHPPTAAGVGFECDKLSATALEKHFAAYMGKVIEESGDLAGKSLLFSEIDSYEMGWQNWTDGFGEIFKKEKGYDLIPFLPLMAGRLIADEDTADAVCSDFRAVVTDLMTKNYFQRFTELCNENGMLSYIEPYGNGPLNNLGVGGRCDIPMGEFWMSKTTIVRSAVQAAHVYGKPVISAESFTSWADLNWKGHPYLMKEYGDKAWALGINEFMFHRFAHQANPHVAPGMTMGSVGSHIDRTQTWWYNAGKAWNEYNQRGSFMLRQGVPVSDVLSFIGDDQPSGDAPSYKIGLPPGFNVDGCGAEVLHKRVTVKDGKLVLPEGTTYSVLMLHGCEKLHLSSLKRLQELAEAGATIVGTMPKQPISYKERQTKSKEFSALAKQLWGNGKATNKVGKGLIVNSEKFPSDPASIGLERDLMVKELSNPEFMHRKIGSDDVYFIHHREKVATTLNCSFRVGDRIPELWHADTGKMEKQARFTQQDGRTEMAIDLDPCGSVFVVFRESSKGIDPVVNVSPETGRVIFDAENKLQLVAGAKGNYTVKLASGKTLSTKVSDQQQPIELNRGWRVEFDGPGLVGDKVVDFKTLSDWKDHGRDDIKHFSGTAAYRTMLNVPAGWLAGEKRVMLDLGVVAIAAEVIINGKNAGILWKPPFVIDVTDQVVAGKNKVEIRVTNQWTNRLIGDESLKDTSGYYDERGRMQKNMPDWYVNNEPMPEGPRSTFTTYNFYKKDRELLPSGLLGPVVLKQQVITKIGK